MALAAARVKSRTLPLVILMVIAAGFLALGVAEARADAPTFDEPVYVSAGLAAVLHHDVTLNDEHPPLLKVLAVVPVLFAHPVVPADGRWNTNDELSYAARFTSAQLAAGKLASVTFAARLVPLLVSGLGHGTDESALAAAKRMSFSPATRCGKAVPSSFVISVRFALGD